MPGRVRLFLSNGLYSDSPRRRGCSGAGAGEEPHTPGCDVFGAAAGCFVSASLSCFFLVSAVVLTVPQLFVVVSTEEVVTVDAVLSGDADAAVAVLEEEDFLGFFNNRPLRFRNASTSSLEPPLLAKRRWDGADDLSCALRLVPVYRDFFELLANPSSIYPLCSASFESGR